MRANYDLVGVPVKFVIRSTKDKLNSSKKPQNDQDDQNDTGEDN